MKKLRRVHALVLTAAALLGYVAIAPAQNTNSNIKATKHNFSTSGTGTVKATSQDQICVFCHTPHAANSAAPAPLWNRKIASGDTTSGPNTYAATYTPYTSNSLDAEDILNGSIGQPGGASKLCLSCHDGTLAIGTVANSPGSGTTGSIPMAAGVDKMPVGAGTTTGFTRNLGVDLRNDHPISFTFDSTLATRDGEFRTPPYTASSKLVVGIRSSGVKPMLPLDHEGKVQCTSCHDPHLDASKFLRLNRFQQNASAGTTFDPTNDQICLGCHDRNKDNQGNAYLAWSNSAHASSSVATYAYKSAASTQREFTSGIKVWEAGCLNCHDTHTVQGSRRLLREGTDNTSSPKAGGSPAIEETCYQCHTTTTASILTVGTMDATSGVPDIKTEFGRSRRMPITSTDQPAGSENHDIGGNFSDATFVNCTGTSNKCGADFIEQRSLLGSGNHTNRHVECTDCHNPHRVIKNALFNGQGSATRRTHVPAGANGNLASGALRGMWGVEPTWGPTGNWPELPSTYAVKRGDPGASTTTTKAQTFLTREYQLCLKCHSDYGFGTTPPLTGYYTGGSTSNSIGTRYTNIAAELSVNAADTPTTTTDQGEYGECGSNCTEDSLTLEPSGSAPADSKPATMDDETGTQNHRSWHPIHYPTGRTFDERRISSDSQSSSNFRVPFQAAVGTQTMHCSDCHGHNGTWTQNDGPNLATVQGPHGSTNDFLLRGSWSSGTTIGGSGLCFNCHNPSAGTSGAGDNNTGKTSGFNNPGTNDGGGHGNAHNGKPCMRCHVAVPHGWKNKALLVNLNCRGAEDGATSCDVTSGYANYPKDVGTYTSGPYYVESFLRVRIWRASGNWAETACGANGADKPSGKDWMTQGNHC